MEQEFHEVERFTGRDDFLVAANHYQLWFNLARRNSAKLDATALRRTRRLGNS
jgi:hypothetical protein